MKRIYYDAFLNGLILVKQVWREEDGRTHGIVSKDHGPYKAGEKVSGFPNDFVHKSRRTKYHQMVITARLPNE